MPKQKREAGHTEDQYIVIWRRNTNVKDAVQTLDSIHMPVTHMGSHCFIQEGFSFIFGQNTACKFCLNLWALPVQIKTYFLTI